MQTLIEYKKAGLLFEITETLEAGIKLNGFETKSLRRKDGTLDGSYVTIRGGEAFIIGSFIPPYQEKNTPEDYDPRRNRKLLLTKKELADLANTESSHGLTIVPLSMYNKGRVIKVKLGIARGKKKFDKRQTLKKRESDREIARTLKDR